MITGSVGYHSRHNFQRTKARIGRSQLPGFFHISHKILLAQSSRKITCLELKAKGAFAKLRITCRPAIPSHVTRKNMIEYKRLNTREENCSSLYTDVMLTLSQILSPEGRSYDNTFHVILIFGAALGLIVALATFHNLPLNTVQLVGELCCKNENKEHTTAITVSIIAKCVYLFQMLKYQVGCKKCSEYSSNHEHGIYPRDCPMENSFDDFLALKLLCFAPLLTVGALLGTSSQQQLCHGHIVGHDSDIEGQETLAVWGVVVQLLQTVLGQKQLNQVHLLVLHRLEQRFITLELRYKESEKKWNSVKSLRCDTSGMSACINGQVNKQNVSKNIFCLH